MASAAVADEVDLPVEDIVVVTAAAVEASPLTRSKAVALLAAVQAKGPGGEWRL